MVTATKYISTLIARPSPGFSDFMAAAMASGDGSRAVEQMERSLARGQSEAASFIARLRKLTQRLERAIATTGEVVDIGSVIEAALEIERQSVNEQKACRKLARRLAKFLRRHDPDFWGRVAPLIGRFDEIGADYLDSLQDIRWDLMALDAKVNPSKTGSTFQTPQDVRRHLASLQA